MDTRPFGIFDSGLGGLTVAREIYQRFPQESTIYVGDTARVPYGTRSQKTVIRFTCQIVNFLVKQNVKMAIIACSTASALALPNLRKQYSIPIYGMIEPATTLALTTSRNQNIGIIGTKNTINSKAYENSLIAQNPHLTLYSQACPLFVPLVEENLVAGPIAQAISNHYLRKLSTSDIDTLILGCTHYPLLETVIKKSLKPNVALINTGVALSHYLKTDPAFIKLQNQSPKPQHHYYATDDPDQFRFLANRFLPRPIPSSVRSLTLT